MTLTTYKYQLPLRDIIELQLPVGAKPLHVGLDPNDQYCLWALVDTDQNLYTTRKFRFAGTGHPIIESNPKHIGSFAHQAFVWHVFEVN